MSHLIKFYQNDQLYYVTALKFSELIKSSYVLTYESDPKFGYQRNPNRDHYKKIAQQFQNVISPIFPTAILLAIDEKDVENKFDNYEYDFGESSMLFRIVDGQHRIEGLKLAIQEFPNKREEIENMEFATIIMVIKNNERHIEVKTFCDVNIKAKPIKKDLAYLAQYRINRIENVPTSDKREDCLNEIGIAICNKLNENQELKVWNNAFSFDTVQSQKGIVGIKSFIESIKGLYTNEYHSNLSSEDIDYIIPERIISNYLLPCWIYLRSKFDKCFNEPSLLNDENEPIYYNVNFQLQKTLGVKVLHRLLKYCKDECDDDPAETILLFIDKIERANLTSSDWQKGSEFASISSEAGYTFLAKQLFSEEI